MFAFPYGKANNALLWSKAIIYIFRIVYGVCLVSRTGKQTFYLHH